MRCITDQTTQPPHSSAAWRFYTEGLSVAVFDIETTGLSSTRDSLILGGLMIPGAPGQLSQFLASSPAEEGALLTAYIEKLSEADIWISYNGDTFDRPFLAQRLRRCGISETLPFHCSFDLYRQFRRYWPMAKLLPDLRQTSVEAALGLADVRTDKIDGKESVHLYEEYVRTGSQTAEEKILLHNRDDLLMLHRLMTVLNKLDLHKIMFQRGFMTAFQHKGILAEKITLGKNFLKLEGSTKGIDGDYEVFEDAFHWSHGRQDRRFFLSIPCIYENNTVFVDGELFTADLAPLAEYPTFINGYLLLHDGLRPSYREMNHLIKIILTDILKKI